MVSVSVTISVRGVVSISLVISVRGVVSVSDVVRLAVGVWMSVLGV